MDCITVTIVDSAYTAIKLHYILYSANLYAELLEFSQSFLC